VWQTGISSGSSFSHSIWDTWPSSGNWTDVQLMNST
jgi:hypothetical protein